MVLISSSLFSSSITKLFATLNACLDIYLIFFAYWNYIFSNRSIWVFRCCFSSCKFSMRFCCWLMTLMYSSLSRRSEFMRWWRLSYSSKEMVTSLEVVKMLILITNTISFHRKTKLYFLFGVSWILERWRRSCWDGRYSTHFLQICAYTIQTYFVAISSILNIGLLSTFILHLFLPLFLSSSALFIILLCQKLESCDAFTVNKDMENDQVEKKKS